MQLAFYWFLNLLSRPTLNYNVIIMAQLPHDQDLPRSEGFSQPVSRNRFAVLTVVVYSLVVLSVALLAGNRLYDRARVRIMSNSSVSSMTDLETFAPVSVQKPVANQAPESSSPAAASGATSVELNPTPSPQVPPINILLLGTDALSE